MKPLLLFIIVTVAILAVLTILYSLTAQRIASQCQEYYRYGNETQARIIECARCYRNIFNVTWCQTEIIWKEDLK